MPVKVMLLCVLALVSLVAMPVVLPMVTESQASQWVALADSGCVQVSYSQRLVPFSVDPNVIRGYLLPLIPGDPNTWTVKAGKFNRPHAVCCDPNMLYPVAVEYVGGTVSGVTVDVNNVDHTWTWAADLSPIADYHVMHFIATNSPKYGKPSVREFTFLFQVLEPVNYPPVLQ